MWTRGIKENKRKLLKVLTSGLRWGYVREEGSVGITWRYLWTWRSSYINNRTHGTTLDIFKKLGDTAEIYSRTKHDATVRHSSLSMKLHANSHECPVGFNFETVRSMCSPSAFSNGGHFEVGKSKILYQPKASQAETQYVAKLVLQVYDSMIRW